MTFTNRYRALEASHRSVEEKIEDEMKRPNPDSLTLQRLKRRKLLLKDEIEAWERLMGAVGLPPEADLNSDFASSARRARKMRSSSSHGGHQVAHGGLRMN